MTALRPERDSAAPYGEDAGYGGAAAFEATGAFEGAAAFEANPDPGPTGDGRTGGAMRAAVDGLADPLSDPLPGRRRHAAPEREWYDPQAYTRDWSVGQSASSPAEPVRRAHAEPAHGYSEPLPPYSAPQPPHVQPQASYGQPQSQPSYPDARSSSYAGPQPPYAEPQASFAEPPMSFTEPQPPFTASPWPYQGPQPRTGPGGPGPAAGYQEARTPYAGAPGPSGAPQAPYDAAYAPTAPFPAPSRRSQPSSPSSPPYGTAPAAEETVALPVVGPESISGFPTPSAPAAAPVRPLDAEALSGGRAARRKAARRHGKHGGAGGAGGVGETHEEQTDTGAPLSRVAARRAAKARKPGAAVMASRAIGEVFITTGVLMLLFVTYQLWWTNIRANAQAGSEASSLQNDWANGKRNPGTFEPGQGFALLRIPKLDVVVPIAEGIDKKRVLDRGMVGHYAEKGLQTAMPDAKTGNFGLAGHRNTHGEPFRYINRLKPGDAIVVETQDKYFVYKMASILPVTAPSNTAVLDAIPKGSTFKSAGRYITLTTCTPEFTSKYRMIVWGTMVEERPRSEGKPDALVG